MSFCGKCLWPFCSQMIELLGSLLITALLFDLFVWCHAFILAARQALIKTEERAALRESRVCGVSFRPAR